jgi:hypothetical protein
MGCCMGGGGAVTHLQSLIALRERVERAEAALAKYLDDLCEGFCKVDEWHDAGHDHPHFQQDCGGCLAASVLIRAMNGGIYDQTTG